MKPTAEPIATAIRSADISRATPADLDDVLDILNEAARWLSSRGIKQWPTDGFPRDLIARDIAYGEVYIARRDRRAVGTFTLQWSDELFWPGAAEAAGYIHRIAVRREARGLGLELLKFAERATTATGRRLCASTVFRGTTCFATITSARVSSAAWRLRSIRATTRRCRNLPAASSRVSTKSPCTDSNSSASRTPVSFFFFGLTS
jgi:GNAT superfamily N-acetyltransferase